MPRPSKKPTDRNRTRGVSLPPDLRKFADEKSNEIGFSKYVQELIKADRAHGIVELVGVKVNLPAQRSKTKTK